MSSHADHNERMVATLKARIEQLEAALRWYASDSNWLNLERARVETIVGADND